MKTNYEELAGKFEWSESGLVLLAKIQKEIEKNGGEEKYRDIIMDENQMSAPYARRKIVKRKGFTPEETEFIFHNWHKMKLDELSARLECDVKTIRSHAYNVLNLSYKRDLAA